MLAASFMRPSDFSEKVTKKLENDENGASSKDWENTMVAASYIERATFIKLPYKKTATLSGM